MPREGKRDLAVGEKRFGVMVPVCVTGKSGSFSLHARVRERGKKRLVFWGWSNGGERAR